MSKRRCRPEHDKQKTRPTFEIRVLGSQGHNVLGAREAGSRYASHCQRLGRQECSRHTAAWNASNRTCSSFDECCTFDKQTVELTLVTNISVCDPWVSAAGSRRRSLSTSVTVLPRVCIPSSTLYTGGRIEYILCLCTCLSATSRSNCVVTEYILVRTSCPDSCSAQHLHEARRCYDCMQYSALNTHRMSSIAAR